MRIRFSCWGQTYEDLGQMSAAIEAWEKAVDLQPHSREGLYKLSRALEKTDPKLSATYRDRFWKSLESSQQIQNRRQFPGTNCVRGGQGRQLDPRRLVTLMRPFACAATARLPGS